MDLLLLAETLGAGADAGARLQQWSAAYNVVYMDINEMMRAVVRRVQIADTAALHSGLNRTQHCCGKVRIYR